ncbi:MAG: hypothetical protein A2W33_03795 [Chloroflexi bacterium RBG_16_52_11]|nr:MAG: hypothetical protein A2W33_03795 [Chloroflexi bacterium RBG_16_52_11]
MDTVKEYSKRPLFVGIAGLLIGLILGLIYAWLINPVEWTDAPVDLLRPDLQEDYMRMAIDSYTVNQDAALAQTRYEAIGENKENILAQIEANPGEQSPQSIAAFKAVVTTGVPAVATPPATTPGVTTPMVTSSVPAAPVEEEGGFPTWTIVILLICVLGLALGGGLFYLLYWRNRSGGQASPAKREAQPAERQPEWTEYAAPGEEPPTVQFMASYKLGDDLFDDSFSIDSPTGEFLGECGAGISETIGVGEPKRVTAFEVWLFDKNDIQTVTKVLMSAHAFLDDATRQRLESKGDPVLAEPGSEIVLETQTLKLVARVVDMAYGDGALPEQSFFDRLILELSVWPRS